MPAESKKFQIGGSSSGEAIVQWNDKTREAVMLLSAIFPISSLAGLAALLRSKRKLDRRAIISAILNSGLMGVCIGAGGYHLYGGEHLWFIVASSILAGLGGNAAVDFVIQLAFQIAQKRYGDDS